MGLDIRKLGTPDLTYRRLSLVISQLPTTSATVRAMVGEAVDWSVTDHLLAGVLDALNAGNWQRGGGKGKRPSAIPRPGKESGKRFGGNPMTLDEAKERFARKDGD